MRLRYGTNYLYEDEPALNLAEVNLMNPVDGFWHRYQIVVVWRNDKPHEARKDMGLAKDFKAGQFRVMGGYLDGKELFIEETVGTLREMADEMRTEQQFDLQELSHYKLSGLL